MFYSINKKPNEKFPVGFLYSAPDIDEGATITECAVSIVTTDEENLLLTSGSPIINGAEVAQVVYGGKENFDYILTFKVTTSEDNIYEDRLTVKVRS